MEQTPANSSSDDKKELSRFQPTAAEKQQVVMLSLFYLCVFLCIGVPLWLKTTATYQAPLPFWEIKALCSSPIHISVPVSIVSFSDQLTASDLTIIQSDLTASSDPKVRCGFEPAGSKKLALRCSITVRSASDAELKLYTKLTKEPLILDDFLAEMANMLLQESCLSNDVQCIQSPYAIIVLPTGIQDLFPVDDSSVRWRIRPSASLTVVFLVAPSGNARQALTTEIASLMNTILLPITELQMLVNSSTSSPMHIDQRKIDRAVIKSRLTTSKNQNYLPPSTEYDVMVTILPHSGDLPRDTNQTTGTWSHQILSDPTVWLETHVQSVFSSWLPYVIFRFSSQRLHAVDIEKLETSRMAKNRTFKYYTANDLSTLVNQLESYLGAPQTASAATRDMAGTKPGLHLIMLLAQDKEATPLRFYLPSNPHGEAVLTDVAVVPQWGGLFSIDANVEQPAVRVGRQLAAVIRLIAGLPEPPAHIQTHLSPKRGPGDAWGAVDRWEMDSWFLRRTAESLLSIRMTMTALVDLLSRFPNMVINDYVADEVARSVRMWGQTLDQLRTVVTG
ncbi:unnamed protein product [Dicrocoelium dendriticum]|nr:unnamed protein product [Dicrocoelium dendriticum]